MSEVAFDPAIVAPYGGRQGRSSRRTRAGKPSGACIAMAVQRDFRVSSSFPSVATALIPLRIARRRVGFRRWGRPLREPAGGAIWMVRLRRATTHGGMARDVAGSTGSRGPLRFVGYHASDVGSVQGSPPLRALVMSGARSGTAKGTTGPRLLGGFRWDGVWFLLRGGRLAYREVGLRAERDELRWRRCYFSRSALLARRGLRGGYLVRRSCRSRAWAAMLLLPVGGRDARRASEGVVTDTARALRRLTSLAEPRSSCWGLQKVGRGGPLAFVHRTARALCQ